MSEDIVVRLRDGFDRNLRHAAIDTIEALRGEVESLKTQRDEYLQFWKNNVEACEEAEAEAARLKGALEEAVKWMEGCAVGGGYPAWYVKARKALAGETT